MKKGNQIPPSSPFFQNNLELTPKNHYTIEVIGSDRMNGTQINLTFQSENTSFETNGLYYIKGNTTYILFDEKQEVGLIKTTVKINEDEVLITRSGPVSMRQLFKKNEQTSGTLKSPYGNFLMETKTDQMEYSYGKLFVSYTLTLNGEETDRQSITIKFKEEAE